MQSFKTLGDAIRLAEFAHFSQLDKAGLPYIEHPRRVLEKVKAQGALPFVQQSAILHDVTEDTKFTPEILEDLGFSVAVVEIIRLIDRDYSELLFHSANNGRDLANGKYKGKRWYTSLGPRAQDEFYYRGIAENPYAYMVKLADIEDNLTPWRLAYLPGSEQERLRVKYFQAKMFMAGELDHLPIDTAA
jgi:hypothetical protein